MLLPEVTLEWLIIIAHPLEEVHVERLEVHDSRQCDELPIDLTTDLEWWVLDPLLDRLLLEDSSLDSELLVHLMDTVGDPEEWSLPRIITIHLLLTTQLIQSSLLTATHGTRRDVTSSISRECRIPLTTEVVTHLD